MIKFFYITLLTLFSFTASADHSKAEKISDWFLIDDDHTITAYTENETSRLSRVLMRHGKSVILTISKVNCSAGEVIPILVSIDNIYLSTEAKCASGKNSEFLIIDKNILANDRSLSEPVIGFAIPLRGGNFRIEKFSLVGSADAVITTIFRSSPLPQTLPKNSP